MLWHWLHYFCLFDLFFYQLLQKVFNYSRYLAYFIYHFPSFPFLLNLNYLNRDLAVELLIMYNFQINDFCLISSDPFIATFTATSQLLDFFYRLFISQNLQLCLNLPFGIVHNMALLFKISPQDQQASLYQPPNYSASFAQLGSPCQMCCCRLYLRLGRTCFN